MRSHGPDACCPTTWSRICAGPWPRLFDDEDLDAHRARRDPVLAAQPSASAKRKKRSSNRGRTADPELPHPDGGDGDACPSPVPNRLGPGRSEAATTHGTDAAAATGSGVGYSVPSDDQGGFVTYPFIIKELSCLRVWNFGLGQHPRLPESSRHSHPRAVSQFESRIDEKADACSIRGPSRPAPERPRPIRPGPAYRHDMRRTASRPKPKRR